MKKLTLQWRITLLTALILAISSIALTAAAMANAEQSFVLIMESSLTRPPEAPTATNPQQAQAAVMATPALQAKRMFDSRSITFCAAVTVLGSVAAY